ncbi:MAG: preprotein translocase subunit SecE [Candidatus Paceibacterota bacterium]|jgi:preprotein translocase subunit SecE
MSKISNYLSETKEEMKHVSWPTKKQTMTFTILVIAISIFVAAYLGLFDYIFSIGLKNLI